MKKKLTRQWSHAEEIELDHLYSAYHWSLQDIAKKFNCTVAEVRRKVKDMGIEQ